MCWLLRLLVRCGLDELDLEKAVLRHQLKVLRRGLGRAVFTTADRAFLAASARVMSRDRWRSFLVGPDTLVRWHRDLLRRRVRGSRRPGRPPLDPSIKHLILRLGRENPRWGYLRIRGELLKLGIDVSATTIATVLRQGGLGPAPRRIGPTWAQFLRLQASGLLSLGTPGAEEGPEDLASDPLELPAGISAAPGTTEEDQPIHEDPPASMRRPFVAAEAPERAFAGPASATHWNSRSGRARDGCLIAEAGPTGLSPHGDLGVACLVVAKWNLDRRSRTWSGMERPDPNATSPISRPDRVSLPHRLTWALVGPEDAGVISSRESP